MKDDKRSRAIELAKQSGMASCYVSEIEDGCSWRRIYELADCHISDVAKYSGSCLGLDPKALFDLLELCAYKLC